MHATRPPTNNTAPPPAGHSPLLAVEVIPAPPGADEDEAASAPPDAAAAAGDAGMARLKKPPAGCVAAAAAAAAAGAAAGAAAAPAFLAPAGFVFPGEALERPPNMRPNMVPVCAACVHYGSRRRTRTHKSHSAVVGGSKNALGARCRTSVALSPAPKCSRRLDSAQACAHAHAHARTPSQAGCKTHAHTRVGRSAGRAHPYVMPNSHTIRDEKFCILSRIQVSPHYLQPWNLRAQVCLFSLQSRSKRGAHLHTARMKHA